MHFLICLDGTIWPQFWASEACYRESGVVCHEEITTSLSGRLCVCADGVDLCLCVCMYQDGLGALSALWDFCYSGAPSLQPRRYDPAE